MMLYEPGFESDAPLPDSRGWRRVGDPSHV
jgi:hypothetical protein